MEQNRARKSRQNAPVKRTHTEKLEQKLGELQSELRLKDIELDIYKELGKASFKKTSFSVKLNRFLEFLFQAFTPVIGAAYLVDEDAGELILAAYKGPKLPAEKKSARMKIGKGLAGVVTTSGRAGAEGNIRAEAAWFKNLAGGNALDTIAVPIKKGRKVTGVVQIINSKGNAPFNDKDLRCFSRLTKQFSVVADKSYVFDDLEERIEDFSTLNDVGRLLISTLKEDSIRHRALSAITELMGVEAGSLLLVDKEKGELYFEVALGVKSDKIKDLKLKVGEGIAGWVAKYGKPLVINDVDADDRFYAKLDEMIDFKTRSILCVPVRVKGKVIAVLQAINKERGLFVDRDLDLFILFSSQVAIALDNARLHTELRQTFFETSEALAEAIEQRDPYTGGHTKRVLQYSLAIAKRLELGEEATERLKLAAILHDVGKIGIDDRILKKEAPLDKNEQSVMMEHPTIGAQILKRVPQLRDVVPGTLYHHERVDGKGYPKGYAGEEIPLMARIIAVSDTYDAMTTDRPYRKGLTDQDAIDELIRCSDTQFDRKLVDAFIEAHKRGDHKDPDLLR